MRYYFRVKMTSNALHINLQIPTINDVTHCHYQKCREKLFKPKPINLA